MDTALNTTPQASQPPLRERLNLRIVVFVGILLFIFGSIAYSVLDTMLTSGIRERGDYYEVDLKAMSDWEMDPVLATDNVIPKQFRELDGKRVQLEGEIAPGTIARGQTTQFDLVYSVQKCCFSGQPKIQHFIKSKVVSDKPVAVAPGGLYRAVGTLHVGIERDELNPNSVKSVFRFDVESIEAL